MASVTMNGGMPKRAMKMPDTAPVKIPTPTPAAIPATTAAAGMAAALEEIAAITTASATIDPTDRSIPPLRMTKVMPTARITRWELLISRFEIVLGWRMAP